MHHLTHTNRNPILIVGTGAMACLFAARLSAVGAQIIMLGNWVEALQALSTYGVHLVKEKNQEIVHPVRVITPGTELMPVGYALVLVKSWQTEYASHQLASYLKADGLAVSLQNGLGNLEKLAKVLGRQRVILGMTTVGAALLEPGKVRSGGEGKISLSLPPDHSPSDIRLQALLELLSAAGFSVEQVENPDSLLWGKLVISAAINPLTALLGIHNGELLKRESAYEIMRSAAMETAAVANSKGIHLPYADPIAEVESVARRTASNRSSMLQDVQRGAPTEIDAICGAIAAEGGKLGIPTPINWTLWKLVKAKAASSSK